MAKYIFFQILRSFRQTHFCDFRTFCNFRCALTFFLSIRSLISLYSAERGAQYLSFKPWQMSVSSKLRILGNFKFSQKIRRKSRKRAIFNAKVLQVGAFSEKIIMIFGLSTKNQSRNRSFPFAISKFFIYVPPLIRMG